MKIIFSQFASVTRFVRQSILVATLSFVTLALAFNASAADHSAGHATTSEAVATHTTASHAGHDHSHGASAEPTFSQMFGYSYLTAFMFCLSIVLGALFLVIVHHLFDASWSVPVRRVAEQIACLAPYLAVLLIPLLLLQKQIFPWTTIDPATDHALDVKKGLYNTTSFTVGILLLFGIWTWMAFTFRKWSIAQDKDGLAKWTLKARKLAAGGIFIFAFSLTLGVFFLMKSLQYQFFSTMYGVYYFAGSVWTTLITMYVLGLYLREKGPLKGVFLKRQQTDLGVWFFAFTVFYAYIHFSQYFLIWNAAMPEETFWYVNREAGSWKWVGMLILFGHFIVPFLLMLNQDIKRNLSLMLPMAVWAWLMHYNDMTFNVMPVLYPDGLHLTLLDPLCWGGLVAILAFFFWKNFQKAAPYPLRDPRLKEALTEHHVPAMGEAAAHH